MCTTSITLVLDHEPAIDGRLARRTGCGVGSDAARAYHVRGSELHDQLHCRNVARAARRGTAPPYGIGCFTNMSHATSGTSKFNELL